ncbi:MAG: SCO family protein [Phycisphaerales bacterium]|nr:SCO family protein [Phycisphaerales bacterium]
MRLAGILVVLLVAAGIAALIVLDRRPPPQAAPDPGLEGLRLQDFQLVDQDGEPVDQRLLEGHVTIVDFMFTHCQLVCPRMTGEMAMLHDRLGDVPVRFVSFSVDPDRDTPEVLRDYAARFEVDHDRWTFCTGSRDVTWGLARAIGFEMAEDTRDENIIELDGGTTMRNITHPNRLLLVGPDRQILGLYNYADPADLERLEARARELVN